MTDPEEKPLTLGVNIKREKLHCSTSHPELLSSRQHTVVDERVLQKER
jgi:hypothetical protein